MELYFKTGDDVDSLLEALQKTVATRNVMGGALYWNILNEQACEIANRLLALGVDADKIRTISGLATWSVAD